MIMLAVTAQDGMAIPEWSRAAPAKLVGRWTRTVTSADIKRSYGYGNRPGSICTLTVTRTGLARLVVGHVGTFEGAVIMLPGNRVHFTFGDPTGNVYRWRVSGRLLSLTKIRDGTPDRATAMWGVWKRK